MSLRHRGARTKRSALPLVLVVAAAMGVCAPEAIAQSPAPMPSTVTTTSRFTTCGGHAYPGLGIDAPVEYGSIDEIQALEPALLRFADAFPGATDWPWRLAGRDETGMLFLARTDADEQPGWVSIEVEAIGDGWQPASMGSCDPHVVTSPDLGPTDWWPDPAYPAPDVDSTDLHVVVFDRECDTGSFPAGRVAEPVIVYRPTTVTITIGVHRSVGVSGCEGDPLTPFTVRLAEPLGGRTLLDGGHAIPVVATAPVRRSPSTMGRAEPRAVLEAYLAALQAGDCEVARSYAAATFRYGNGELCGHLTVTAATIDPGGPATPSGQEVVFSATITTVGGDASMPDGTMTWFYQLLRQPDGRWLIAGGGSGP